VIAPISLWLAWQKTPTADCSADGGIMVRVAVMFALALLWIVARGTGDLVLSSFWSSG